MSDELYITEDDYLERQLLVKEFSKQPEEFFSQMRHFQPQVGCLNCCAICSKKLVQLWSIGMLRELEM